MHVRRVWKAFLLKKSRVLKGRCCCSSLFDSWHWVMVKSRHPRVPPKITKLMDESRWIERTYLKIIEGFNPRWICLGGFFGLLLQIFDLNLPLVLHQPGERCIEKSNAFFSAGNAVVRLFFMPQEVTFTVGQNIPVSKRLSTPSGIYIYNLDDQVMAKCWWPLGRCFKSSKKNFVNFRCLNRDLRFGIHRNREPTVPLRCFNDMRCPWHVCLRKWVMGHHPCEMLSALAQSLCMTAADPKRKATKKEELDKLILLDSLQKRESSQRISNIPCQVWETVKCLDHAKVFWVDVKQIFRSMWALDPFYNIIICYKKYTQDAWFVCGDDMIWYDMILVLPWDGLTGAKFHPAESRERSRLRQTQTNPCVESKFYVYFWYHLIRSIYIIIGIQG